MAIKPSLWQINILILACLFVTFLLVRKESTVDDSMQQPPLMGSVGSSNRKGSMGPPNSHNPRNAVGGFSNLPPSELRNEDVWSVANFAVNQLLLVASGREDDLSTVELEGIPSMPRAVVPDSEVYQSILAEFAELASVGDVALKGSDNGDNGDNDAGGAIQIVVLEAQRQVVAGLNYKLKLALLKGGKHIMGTCIGGFQVTVYNHFGELSVIHWGKEMGCAEIMESYGDLTGLESGGNEFGVMPLTLMATEPVGPVEPTDENDEKNENGEKSEKDEKDVLRQEEETVNGVNGVNDAAKALMVEEEVKEEHDEVEPEE